MNEEIRAAIEERIGLGYTKEDIVQELQSAGYPAEVAGDFYDTVSGATTPDTVFPTEPLATPPNQPPVASVEQESIVVPNVTQQSSALAYDLPTQHHKSLNRNNYLVLGFLLFLGVAALTGGVYAAKGGSLLQKIGLLGSVAPYASEVEMMGGMFSHFQSLTAYGFNLDYEVALEPRDPSTPTVSEDFFSEGELDNLADAFAYTVSEGFAKFTASGLVDVRDKTNPKFDISMQLNVLAEPFILNAGGSMLVTNNTVYGKIDKFPANFRPFLFGVPENTWIILQSGLEFDAWPSAHPLVPMGGIQAYKEFTPTIVQLYTGEIWRLMTLGHQEVTQVAQETSKQMASGITALGLDTSMGPEERQMIERSLALLKQYPVIRFTGEPEQVKVNEEVLYRYDVDIDYENLRLYFSNVLREAQSITGQAMSLSESEMEYLLPDREVVDEINRLTDIVLTFRPDGGLAEMAVTGALAFNHPDITSQARLHMSVSHTRQNDGLHITAPTDVHPKTLEEIMEEQMKKMLGGECMGDSLCESINESRTVAIDATVKQTLSSVRVLAELSYDQYGFTYAKVCEDPRVIGKLFSLEEFYPPGVFLGFERDSVSAPGKIVCNDREQSYAVAAPLASDVSRSLCVDSTGFFGEVSPYILSTRSDTSCQ
jgi:hypothetical protein